MPGISLNISSPYTLRQGQAELRIAFVPIFPNLNFLGVGFLAGHHMHPECVGSGNLNSSSHAMVAIPGCQLDYTWNKLKFKNGGHMVRDFCFL